MPKPSLLALLLCITANASCGEPNPTIGGVDAQGVADHAVQLLVHGQIRTVASIMHYPPTYTSEKRAKDVASVGANIEMTTRELGAISEVRAFQGLTTCYELGGTGGDLPYLASLSPDYLGDFFYEATYSKHGPGYLRIRILRLTPKSHFEILGVYFGLPMSDPRSKPVLVGIARKQLARMGVPVTPELVRQIEESVQPTKYAPGSTQ